MTEVRYPVITISRQYAACGRTIARGLQDRLGIPFYDRDFVKKTAEESGYSVEDIAREGETMSRVSKFMNSLLNNAAVYNSSYDSIYEAQKKVVLSLSEKPCIIIGRCADHILREAGVPSFNIYLYADMDVRKKRAEEIGDCKDMDVEKYVSKVDALRETYYKKYTGNDMGNTANYDICLNVGKIGVDRCIDLLVDILQK